MTALDAIAIVSPIYRRTVAMLVTDACVAGALSFSGAPTRVARIARRGYVMLVPDTSAGFAGWCMVVIAARSRRRRGAGYR
jgi:hypothetical protein